MKVIFIINEPIQRASGGYKVVYEYANSLDKIGDSVQIVYRCKEEILFSNYNIPFSLKILLAKIIAYIGPKWFNLNKNIKRKIVLDISDETIEDADIVIATAVDTAEEVKNLTKSKGEKFYLIQGYETWVYPERRVHLTYSYEMNKIVVAKWLKEMVDCNSNKPSIYIPNGIDNNIYKVVNSIEERDKYSISMMYHNLESKGSDDGIKVLIALKEKYHLLKASVFGIPKRPKNLPTWIEYICCASQNEVVAIYNKSSIFLCSSWNEGFGLTGAEAMMCGCALVSTETFGVKEYANYENSKLVPIKQVNQLLEACISLIEDDNQRINMAKKGNIEVTKALNVEKAHNKFVNIIHNERKKSNGCNS